MPPRVLIADDSDKTCKQLRELLTIDGEYEADAVRNGAAALEKLRDKPYRFLLTDLRMPGLGGMELIEQVRKENLPVTMIVLTGYGTIGDAVQAVRLGAYDFLTKPIDVDHLKMVLDRASRERRLQEEVAQLREQVHGKQACPDLISKSPRMQAVFELIRNVAATSTTVLIEGETGTGKEQIGRALHAASASHRCGAWVAVNCAALPETLLESELFGHEKGAFTGAMGQRIGRFEQANGGTLFLDEIGDVSPAVQIKLLRVLQERCIERLGASDSIEVDVRVVAATNRSLERLVRKGRFREDLFYRLNVVRLVLPPLRERREDIPLLASHFAARFARPGEAPKTFSPAAMERLLAHSWPGNIRELENAVERASVTARGPVVEPIDLPLETVIRPPESLGGLIDLNRPLPELVNETTRKLEKAYLRRALKRTHGNVGRCAELCGLTRRSISAKLAEYGINKEEFKDGAR